MGKDTLKNIQKFFKGIEENRQIKTLSPLLIQENLEILFFFFKSKNGIWLRISDSRGRRIVVDRQIRHVHVVYMSAMQAEFIISETLDHQ